MRWEFGPNNRREMGSEIDGRLAAKTGGDGRLRFLPIHGPEMAIFVYLCFL